MDQAVEEQEHVRAIIEAKLGPAWARAARIVRVERVCRVTLRERSAGARRAVLWSGPERITERLRWVELEESERDLGRRAVCLDAMTEALQARVSEQMNRWARASRSYPVVSVGLEGEHVAEVRFAGSRRVALVGMRGARLLAVYERHCALTAAALGSIAGAGVAACALALARPPHFALTLGLCVTLAVTLWDTLRRPVTA